jgi:hypothetical protein
VAEQNGERTAEETPSATPPEVGQPAIGGAEMIERAEREREESLRHPSEQAASGLAQDLPEVPPEESVTPAEVGQPPDQATRGADLAPEPEEFPYGAHTCPECGAEVVRQHPGYMDPDAANRESVCPNGHRVLASKKTAVRPRRSSK